MARPPRTKNCELCNRSPRIQGERFCYKCKHRKLREMEASGYLDPPKSIPQRRLDDAQR